MLRLLVKSLFFVVPVPIGVAEAKTMLIFALMLLFLVAVEVECIREVVVVAMKAVVLALKRKREEFKNDREARMSFTVNGMMIGFTTTTTRTQDFTIVSYSTIQ